MTTRAVGKKAGFGWPRRVGWSGHELSTSRDTSLRHREQVPRTNIGVPRA